MQASFFFRCRSGCRVQVRMPEGQRPEGLARPTTNAKVWARELSLIRQLFGNDRCDRRFEVPVHTRPCDVLAEWSVRRKGPTAACTGRGGIKIDKQIFGPERPMGQEHPFQAAARSPARAYA